MAYLIILEPAFNALLLDLKAMGLLIPSININDIIIDKCKFDRAKAKMKTIAQQKHDQSMENLICIAVDGRMDKDTLLYKEILEENGQKTMKKLRDQNAI